MYYSIIQIIFVMWFNWQYKSVHWTVCCN